MKFQFGPGALSRLGDPSKIRVRSVDHGDYVELQVRPTNRDSDVNMPKEEQLVDITGDGAIEIDERYASSLPEGDVTLFVAQTRKHGWYSLTVVRPSGSDAPVVQLVR